MFTYLLRQRVIPLLLCYMGLLLEFCCVYFLSLVALYQNSDTQHCRMIVLVLIHINLFCEYITEHVNVKLIFLYMVPTSFNPKFTSISQTLNFCCCCCCFSSSKTKFSRLFTCFPPWLELCHDTFPGVLHALFRLDHLFCTSCRSSTCQWHLSFPQHSSVFTSSSTWSTSSGFTLRWPCTSCCLFPSLPNSNYRTRTHTHTHVHMHTHTYIYIYQIKQTSLL